MQQWKAFKIRGAKKVDPRLKQLTGDFFKENYQYPNNYNPIGTKTKYES